MSWSKALVVTLCLAAVGCDEDPARSTKIVPRPVTARAVDAQAAPFPSPAAERPTGAEKAAPSKQGASKTAVVPSDGAPTGSAAPASGGKPSLAVPTPSPSPSSAEGRIEGCPPPPEDRSGPSALSATGPCAFQHQGAFSCEASADDFYISASRKAARGATLMVYINVEHYKGPGSYKDAQMFVGVQDRTSIHRWSSDTVSITVGPDAEFAVLPSTQLDAEPVLVGCSGPMTNFQCGGRDSFEAPPVVVSGTMRCEGGAKKK